MIGNVPDTAYFKNAGIAKTIHKVAVSQENIFYAKFLSAYGTEANMKALFFLDFLCERIKVKNTDGTTEVGYMGGVYDDPNGFNYKHHNASKLSRKGLRVKDAGGAVKDIIILNDLLNTRGDANVASTSIQYNGLHVTISGKSAYYNPTTVFGVEWRVKNGSTWTNVLGDDSGEPQNASFAATFVLVDLIIPGNDIDIRAFVTNSEGTYPTPVTTITIGRPSATFGLDGTYASAAYSDFSSSPGTFWFSTIGVQVGTKVYSSSGGAAATAGYYANADMWFKAEIQSLECVVTAVGTIGSWPAGDPATPPTWYNPIYYRMKHADWNTGCTIMTDGTATNPLYQNIANGLYYESQSTSGTLANGYYYDGTRASNGAYMFTRYINGEKVGKGGDCTVGLYL